MGQTTSKINSLFRKKTNKITMIGLDASGKTTMLYKLGGSSNVDIAFPMIGLNIQTTVYDDMQIIAWDVGGSDRIWRLYDRYFEKSSGMIFVIDSNEEYQQRNVDLKQQLQRYTTNKLNQGLPLLIFINKMDLNPGLSEQFVKIKYGLNNIAGHPIKIQFCSAIKQDGLKVGLTWLKQMIQIKNKNR